MKLVLLLFAAAVVATASSPSSVIPMSDTLVSVPPRTGYAPVNGLQLYFEVHGPERAGVLLHGGGDTIETSFGRILPALARERQVIAFEQRGFGHTADKGDRPFGFADSADDTAALLEYLHVKQADLFGFSNGGSIALQVAMRHSAVVRRLIVCTAVMKRAWVPAPFWEAMKTAQPDSMPAPLREAYLKVAPHPENLEVFFYKCRNRMRDFQDVPDEAIRDIQARTLVLGSDRDVMPPESAVALFRLLPHAQLAILPGVSHMEITAETGVLATIITKFLDPREG